LSRLGLRRKFAVFPLYYQQMPNRRGPASWFDEGALLRETGRLEEVEDVLVNYARVAQTRADWGEALLRCEAVYARYPDSGGSYRGPERSL
jgi:hypothetical protein